jgi:hypothetical protein
VAQFDAVCRAIFEAGDRQTYCNRFNDNPHVEAGWFEAWVDPAAGVWCRSPDEAAAITLRPLPFDDAYARLRRQRDHIEIELDAWAPQQLEAAIAWLVDFATRVGKLSGVPNPR